jgi:hypothetical protein
MLRIVDNIEQTTLGITTSKDEVALREPPVVRSMRLIDGAAA